MAADSDKIKMSRLLKLAKKFNCFYLSGNQTNPPQIISHFDFSELVPNIDLFNGGPWL